MSTTRMFFRQKLFSEIQGLPEPMLREVLHFIEVLKRRGKTNGTATLAPFFIEETPDLPEILPFPDHASANPLDA